MEQLQESIFPEKVVTYASFWQRFGAAFVDGFLIFLSWFIIGLSFRAGTVGFLCMLILLMYGPLMEASRLQATVGKKGLRIKVTDLEGRRISYGVAFARHFAKILSGAILLIGYFMMLWTSKSQALHDRIAGTIVVKDDL